MAKTNQILIFSTYYLRLLLVLSVFAMITEITAEVESTFAWWTDSLSGINTDELVMHSHNIFQRA